MTAASNSAVVEARSTERIVGAKVEKSFSIVAKVGNNSLVAAATVASTRLRTVGATVESTPGAMVGETR